jgi:hypothetical protein
MDGCFDMMHYGHANALRQVRPHASLEIAPGQLLEDALKGIEPRKPHPTTELLSSCVASPLDRRLHVHAPAARGNLCNSVLSCDLARTLCIVPAAHAHAHAHARSHPQAKALGDVLVVGLIPDAEILKVTPRLGAARRSRSFVGRDSAFDQGRPSRAVEACLPTPLAARSAPAACVERRGA